jgi:capsular polysaccharide biosynthesis protein
MQESGTPPLDHAGLLAACGLGHIPTIQADAPITRLTDAIWMNETILAVMPAAQLRAFRDRVAALHPAPTGPRQRLYVQRRRLRDVPPRPELDRFLATHDFTPVILEDLTPEAQIRLFQNADTVIAPHGAGLANLLFCPPGTRVLEISPSCEFRPFFWMIAEKLGLPYAVLPCSTKGNSFNGQMQVELPRLKSLFRMLRFFATT